MNGVNLIPKSLVQHAASRPHPAVDGGHARVRSLLAGAYGWVRAAWNPAT